MNNTTFLAIVRLRMMFQALEYYKSLGFDSEQAFDLVKFDRSLVRFDLSDRPRHPHCRSALS